jgi:hypothetical protein
VGCTTQELRHPRAGGVDHAACAHLHGMTIGAAQHRLPALVLAAQGFTAGAGHDVRAFFGGVHGVQHHQPGIVDPAIGIDEATRELRFNGAPEA